MKCTHLPKLNWFILTAVLFAGGFFSSLGAVSLYVSTSGNDSNPGTASQPLRTIGAALSRVGSSGAGSVVEVASGIYAETLSSFPSGASGNPFVLRSAVARGAVILPGSTSNHILFFTGDSNILIDGFVVDAVNVSSNNIWVDLGSTDVVFQNVELKNTRGGSGTGPGSYQGFYIEGNRITLRNCYIHDIGLSSSYSHGVYVTGSSVLVEGCTISNLGGFGIQLYSEHTYKPNNGIIRNNRIFNYARAGGYAQGIYLSSGSGCVAYSNLIYQTGSNPLATGFSLRGNNACYFNTIYNNGNQGINSDGSGTMRNNIVYGNGTNISGGGSASNNLTSNPMFVNASAGDFHLQAGSPAIGAGVAVSGITTDFEGKPRANPPSIGAYEVGGSGGGGIPPPTPLPDPIAPLPPPQTPIIANGGGGSRERTPPPTAWPEEQRPVASSSQMVATSQVQLPLLIAGVVVAALLFSD